MKYGWRKAPLRKGNAKLHVIALYPTPKFGPLKLGIELTKVIRVSIPTAKGAQYNDQLDEYSKENRRTSVEK